MKNQKYNFSKMHIQKLYLSFQKIFKFIDYLKINLVLSYSNGFPF